MTLESPTTTASDTLARWYAAWNAHDVAAVSALVTEDVRYEDPAAHAEVLAGRPEVERYVGSAFQALPDLHLDKIEEWTDPSNDVIASYFRITATFTGVIESPGLPSLAPTNGRIDMLGMDRSEMRDGLLARHQIFWDAAEFGRQIGLVPPRGSGIERLSRRLQHLTASRLRRSA